MPQIAATRDSRITTFIDDLGEQWLSSSPAKRPWISSLISVDNIKCPVLYKMTPNHASDEALPLYSNKQRDCLGLLYTVKAGKIFLLPEYKDNEYAIVTFLNRVLPYIGKQPERRDIIDVFSSPNERLSKQELETVEQDRKTLEERHDKVKENVAAAERAKRRVIESDETAVRIIAYYKQAAQDDDAALFYLYKIVDSLQNTFGGETAAKNKLGQSEEWKLIKRIANESYRDIRHAPKPGEKIKQWSEEEIAKCRSAAEKIVLAYFSTLF